jgi:hypothetical protein
VSWPLGSPLLPINLDVMTVTTTVLGALPELRRWEPELRAEIRAFDAALADRLERYTVALQQAQARYNATSSRRESLVPLAADLARLRKQLLSQARSLTYSGWIVTAHRQVYRHGTSSSFQALDHSGLQ